MIGTLLPLLGCHVFSTAAIDCFAGQPCAGGGDTDPDTAIDTGDSGDTADSADDTAVVIEPSRSFLVSATGSRGERAYAFGPVGETLAIWKDFGGVSGPLAYDAASGLGLMVGDGVLWWLYLDQETPTGTDLGVQDVLDVAVIGGMGWVATSDNVGWVDPAVGTPTLAYATSVDQVGAMAPKPGGGVYLTLIQGGVPSLYEWSGTGEPTLVTDAFDTTGARARILFVGPDDEPYTCSSAGGIYRVADLAAGTATPVVYYDGGLTDVSDCGWDAGDATWLVFSPTAGAVRIDAQGRGEVVVSAPDGFTLVRGNFF